MSSNNWDIDEIFAFKTPRFVRIRDRRLGILNVAFQLAIFGYIVGYLVVFQQGYKEEATVIGVSRLQLREPGNEQLPSKDDLPYCGTGYYHGGSAIVPRGECQYLDQFSAQYPRKQAEAIFLSTRITHQLYSRDSSSACVNMTETYCRFNQTAESIFYTIEPELYTLFLDHSVIVPDFRWSKTAFSLPGRLVIQDEDGNKVDPCDAYRRRNLKCPNFIQIGEAGENDIFPIASLLEAAGVDSLDVPAGNLGEIQNETFRYSGLVILVELDYDNYYTYNPNNVRYTYRAHQIQNTEFKIEQPDSFSAQNDQRLVLNRHGIQIVVKQTGNIGRFLFAQLLTVLVTSLGLLAVSSTLVNFTAFSVLPLRYVYRQYRQVDSVDFSDIAHLPESQRQRFKHEDLLNPKPKIFAEGSDSGVLAGGSAPKFREVNRSKPRESGQDFPEWGGVNDSTPGSFSDEGANGIELMKRLRHSQQTELEAKK